MNGAPFGILDRDREIQALEPFNDFSWKSAHQCLFSFSSFKGSVISQDGVSALKLERSPISLSVQ
jgi:hypothetical protein